MLSKKIQNKLYEYFVDKNFQNKLDERFMYKRLRKSLSENFSFEGFQNQIDNKKCFASVAYIDIYNFSNKIKDYSTEKVRNYLFEYYSVVLKYIKKYNGQIDKIMGDGIIVVFSTVFGEISSNQEASVKCFLCCMECIEKLRGSDYEVKAAIGEGTLFFCKIGVEGIYDECSCIGHPLTIAYRLENIADRNQILLMENTKLSNFLKNFKELPSSWMQWKTTKSLKGIDERKVHILQY